jgi:lipoate synthase
MGFVHVEAGPLVRSSYHAHEQADAYEAHATARV